MIELQNTLILLIISTLVVIFYCVTITAVIILRKMGKIEDLKEIKLGLLFVGLIQYLSMLICCYFYLFHSLHPLN